MKKLAVFLSTLILISSMNVSQLNSTNIQSERFHQIKNQTNLFQREFRVNPASGSMMVTVSAVLCEVIQVVKILYQFIVLLIVLVYVLVVMVIDVVTFFTLSLYKHYGPVLEIASNKLFTAANNFSCR